MKDQQSLVNGIDQNINCRIKTLELKHTIQEELVIIRETIDDIDQQIIDLLINRSNCVEKIAQYKCTHQLPIYDGVREGKILDKVTSENPTNYQSVDMANIFNAIIRAGLNQQLLYRAEHKD